MSKVRRAARFLLENDDILSWGLPNAGMKSVLYFIEKNLKINSLIDIKRFVFLLTLLPPKTLLPPWVRWWTHGNQSHDSDFLIQITVPGQVLIFVS